ncbi:MAG: hypothetical protein QOH56_204 [Pseudonocardiales bacterium]|jgi:hypothetical protein|nr:hypothetical protein [Pseudonocardiales bacterium]
MTTDTEIRVLGSRWAQAEQDGDTSTLAHLAAADFRLVGPSGFVLDRARGLIATPAATSLANRWSGTTSKSATSVRPPSQSAGRPSKRPIEVGQPMTSSAPPRSSCVRTNGGCWPACT